MKRLLVTGTTSGIGRAIAESIAEREHHLIMAVRDVKRGHELRHRLNLKNPNARIDVVECNLASRRSIEQCARLVTRRFGELDVLINNAAAMFSKPRLAESGYELTFATNHLGPFHLTNLLLPALKHERIARVVMVASKAHLRGDMNFDQLTQTQNYSMMRAYARSKLANVMFANALARRCENTNLRVNSLHPGTINSNILPTEGVMWPVLQRAATLLGLLKSPTIGAATALYLALDSAASDMHGLYFDEHQIPQPCAPQARQVNLQERLWALSASATAIE